jgi:hypothetical protein
MRMKGVETTRRTDLALKLAYRHHDRTSMTLQSVLHSLRYIVDLDTSVTVSTGFVSVSKLVVVMNISSITSVASSGRFLIHQ